MPFNRDFLNAGAAAAMRALEAEHECGRCSTCATASIALQAIAKAPTGRCRPALHRERSAHTSSAASRPGTRRAGSPWRHSLRGKPGIECDGTESGVGTLRWRAVIKSQADVRRLGIGDHGARVQPCPMPSVPFSDASEWHFYAFGLLAKPPDSPSNPAIEMSAVNPQKNSPSNSVGVPRKLLSKNT